MTSFSSMTPRMLLSYLADNAAELAKARGEPVDRVRKKIAFDFLLHRLAVRAPGKYVLKGGYAIELKFQVVRATKDLDIVTKRFAAAAAAKDADAIAGLLRQRLVDHLAEPQGDEDRHVAFRLDEAPKVLAGGGGGAQFSVRMLIDRQRFTEFSIDLSLEDIRNQPTQTLPLRPLIDGFSKAATSKVVTDEQMFAEKLHAYMRHSDEYQARTKDFADLVLLAQRGLDHGRCKLLIKKVFTFWLSKSGRRGLKGLPPPPGSEDALQAPPESWRPAYERMAKELQIERDMDQAYRLVTTCLAEILAK